MMERPETMFIDLQSQPITSKTKTDLLRAAIELFSRQGFSGVSVRDITREVGIKESSLYNHFRSKDEILETIMCNFRRSFSKIFPPTDQLERILASTDLATFLFQGIHNFQNQFDDDVMGKIWMILFSEQVRYALAREIFLKDVIDGSLDFMERVFNTLISSKRIRPLSSRTLASEYQYPVFSMLTEYLLLKVDDQDTGAVEQRLGEHVQFFVGAVEIGVQ